MTPGLPDFLQDRLDEDEAAAGYCSPAPWQASPRGLYVDDAKGNRLAVANFTEDGRHIARHDPARVLREVKAKRAILRAEMDRALGGVLGYSSVLLDLASIYSDHPDYRQEWKS